MAIACEVPAQDCAIHGKEGRHAPSVGSPGKTDNIRAMNQASI